MSRIRIFSVAGIGIALLATGAFLVQGKLNNQKEAPTKNTPTDSQMSLPLETAQGNGLTSLSDASASWAGELVSPTTIESHPQSEGSIVQLAVRVGQRVARGQVLAQLSPPPASVDRATAASEKMQMLIRARANADATSRLVTKSRIELLEARKSLIPARDAAIALNQKEADRTSYLTASSSVQLEKTKTEKNAAVTLAEKERDQATVKVRAMEQTLKTSVRLMLEKNVVALTGYQFDGKTILSLGLINKLKPTVGIRTSQTRIDYESAVFNVLHDADTIDSTIDRSVAYVDAYNKIVYASAQGDEVSDADISDWQKMAQEQRMEITKMVNDYKESKAMLSVKEADLKKMIAEQDKEITDSSINEIQSRISSESNEITRKKGSIDSELEYQNRVREIDIKLIELNRELELAKADVTAAERAYQTFIGELSSQTVTAQRSGVVSGIFKNTGDYVTPETVVATISQDNTDDAFIRFRIPSDSRLPAVGDEVVVARPSFPFDKKKAIIVGVGGILGENGAFTAEAEFSEKTDWPIHALVRVMPSAITQSILVPFTALRWDEENQSHIYVAVAQGKIADRIVKTGKAVGDRIEIIEGISPKEQYLSRQIPDSVLKTVLVEGDAANTVEMKPSTQDEETKNTDGEDMKGSMEGMHGE